MNEKTHNNNLEHSGETFYPSFLFKEIVVMMLIFILVSVILAVVFPVELGDPADPTDNLFVPKPEWYFMSLYQLLKYFLRQSAFFLAFLKIFPDRLLRGPSRKQE